MEEMIKDHVEELVDYIMHRCLWQFHSRAWDRERQNAEILGKTKQLLCAEPVDLSTPDDRCYWVDAVALANGFKRRFPWINSMEPKNITLLMQALKERMDYLTITKSLNKELTDPLY
ncbi:MAG TPA: Fe-only nitrogenase subunit delta [Firmicutes bacterium]|jgi:nitrogenase delta subunit|nr:Fe-only nitrogenase subunit delta [Bacillota bacterium]